MATPTWKPTEPFCALVDRVAAWIEAGIQPYVFMHMPDNGHAVELAALWTELLREKIPELEALPVELTTPQIGLF